MRELDRLLSRLDTERVSLASEQDVIVPIAELNRLRDLSDHLREAMNRPLGVTRAAAAEDASPRSVDAAASVRVAVRRINALVRKLSPGSECRTGLNERAASGQEPRGDRGSTDACHRDSPPACAKIRGLIATCSG